MTAEGSLNFSLVRLAYDITVYHCSIRIGSLKSSSNAIANVNGISYAINFAEIRDTDVSYNVDTSDAYVTLGSYIVDKMFIQWSYFRLSASEKIKYPEQLVSFKVQTTLSIVSCVRTVEGYYDFEKVPCDCKEALKI